MDISTRRDEIKKRPIHMLVRYSDKPIGTLETIPEHNKVLLKEGMVWFGKLGRPVAMDHIDRINRQVEDNIPTFLYLVQRVGKTYETFVGSIVLISRTFPKKERNLIPEYYFNMRIIDQISMWTKLSKLDEAEKGILNKLIVVTSVMPVAISLASSMAAHFIVRESTLLELNRGRLI